MIHKTFKNILWAFCLLISLSISAQEFDSELQLSNDDVVYWYRICCAMPGMEDHAMTDYNGMTPLCVYYSKVFLLPTETEEYHSQWKLTAGEDGKVIITNRATEQQINSASKSLAGFNSDGSTAIGNINATDLTNGDTPGFNIISLGDNAFKLESVEDDGVNRCLALAEEDGEALTYPETGESSSIIGWKFFPVEIETGIGSAKTGNQVIRVNGKRISVSGCSEWQLFDVAGEEMPRTVSLPTGVYMVKMPQKTVKVMIP